MLSDREKRSRRGRIFTTKNPALRASQMPPFESLSSNQDFMTGWSYQRLIESRYFGKGNLGLDPGLRYFHYPESIQVVPRRACLKIVAALKLHFKNLQPTFRRTLSDKGFLCQPTVLVHNTILQLQ